MPFQVGDLVKWIDHSIEGSDDEVYTVTQVSSQEAVSGNFIWIDSKDKMAGGWFAYRFELVAPFTPCFCHNHQEFAPSCLECMKDYYP